MYINKDCECVDEQGGEVDKGRAVHAGCDERRYSSRGVSAEAAGACVAEWSVVRERYQDSPVKAVERGSHKGHRGKFSTTCPSDLTREQGKDRCSIRILTTAATARQRPVERARGGPR
ncbi:hypothetical protein E2C01_018074 [Portunus trituberculatus]|uniref:Uncharacterized protein n=1 Tax=Portunus trituberculatus TaxID=210409 RepID=A0A5B7DV82_PORTR|nr:hypothetical protein [Portunus trituberculatus]